MPGGAGLSIYQAQKQVAESSHFVSMMQALVSELHAGALEAVPDGVMDDMLFGALELIFKHNRTVTAPTWGGTSRGDQSFAEDRNAPFAKILQAIAYKEVTPAAKSYGMIDLNKTTAALKLLSVALDIKSVLELKRITKAVKSLTQIVKPGCTNPLLMTGRKCSRIRGPGDITPGLVRCRSRMFDMLCTTCKGGSWQMLSI